jgi:hypothetical protein
MIGKPGFGKSTLCTTIIDQLSSKIPTMDGQMGYRLWNAPLTFYMFDSRLPDVNNSTCAMRAVLAQLLHHSPFRFKLIDLAILLKDFQGSGQPTASSDEVQTLLQFFLEKHPNITMVFDGLDECNDIDTFKSCLRLVTRAINSRILLLSRPNVTLDPNSTAGGAWVGEVQVLSLQRQENLGDITTFFEIGLGRLITSQKLVINEPLETFASKLACQSNSMFLWATLMVNYLESDFLSPQDREDLIAETSLFEELDQLYTTILNRLYRKCRGPKARQNFRRLIQWVSVSRRPLRVEELRFALAIEAGQTTKKTRLMKKFEETLPKMTGALLEVTENKTVQAIHASVIEFFTQGSHSNTSPYIRREFDIGAITAHHQVAVDCLSYMSFDGPKERLSLASQPFFTVPSLMKEFPLLGYAAGFWASHTAIAIENEVRIPIQQLAASDHIHQFLPKYISQWMKDRLLVTVWIEASWIFGFPPYLRPLAEMMRNCPIPSIQMLSDQMELFTSELEHLNSRWSRVLAENPGEIWEPSIAAFMTPNFFVSYGQASVVELDPQSTDTHCRNSELSQEPSWILITTESSKDGTEVGSIKVLPSKLVSLIYG